MYICLVWQCSSSVFPGALCSCCISHLLVIASCPGSTIPSCILIHFAGCHVMLILPMLRCIGRALRLLYSLLRRGHLTCFLLILILCCLRVRDMCFPCSQLFSLFPAVVYGAFPLFLRGNFAFCAWWYFLYES